MSLEEILGEVDKMEKETKQYKLELMRLLWYMRGSITLDEIYNASSEDREIMSTLIKENLETAKKTGQPFF